MAHKEKLVRKRRKNKIPLDALVIIFLFLITLISIVYITRAKPQKSPEKSVEGGVKKVSRNIIYTKQYSDDHITGNIS